MTEVLSFLAVCVLLWVLAPWLRRRGDPVADSVRERLIDKAFLFGTLALGGVCATITANHLVSTLGPAGLGSLVKQMSPVDIRVLSTDPASGGGGGDSVALAFASNWGTATGKTQNAWRDSSMTNGTWGDYAGNTDSVFYVRANSFAPGGWTRTDNILQLSFYDDQQWGNLGVPTSALPYPQPDTLWMRVYFNNTDTISTTNHGPVWQWDAPLGLWWQASPSAPGDRWYMSTNWATLWTAQDFGARNRLYPADTTVNYGAGTASGPGLEYNKWYCYEVMIAADSVEAATGELWGKVHHRLYNTSCVADSLAYGEREWVPFGYEGAADTTLAEWYDMGNNLNIHGGTAQDTSKLRRFYIGNEGTAGGTPVSDENLGWFFAAFAISWEDWIGDFIPCAGGVC